MRLGIAGVYVFGTRAGEQPFSPEGHLATSGYVGGDGFGWIFELSASVGSILAEGGSGDRRRLIVRMAVYGGPALHFQVARPLYLGVGAGVRCGVGGYRDDRYTNPLFEVGLRVPVSATFYVHPDVALVLDAGAGPSVGFAGEGGGGVLLVYDASLGFRWP